MLEKGERIYYPALGALICCRCFRLFSQAMPAPLSRRPHHCACMCDRREDRRRERNGKIFLFPCCLQGDYTISKILSNHQQCQDKDKENMYSNDFLSSVISVTENCRVQVNCENSFIIYQGRRILLREFRVNIFKRNSLFLNFSNYF